MTKPNKRQLSKELTNRMQDMQDNQDWLFNWLNLDDYTPVVTPEVRKELVKANRGLGKAYRAFKQARFYTNAPKVDSDRL